MKTKSFLYNALNYETQAEITPLKEDCCLKISDWPSYPYSGLSKIISCLCMCILLGIYIHDCTPMNDFCIAMGIHIQYR